MATTALYTPPSMTVSKTNIVRASRYNDMDGLIVARADLATARMRGNLQLGRPRKERESTTNDNFARLYGHDDATEA